MTQDNSIAEHNSTQHYEVLQELGDCYTTVGRYEQAQHYYEKAASLGPDEPGPYVGLGVIALQKNQLEDAEIAFRVACRLATDCAKAYTGLAMVFRISIYPVTASSTIQTTLWHWLTHWVLISLLCSVLRGAVPLPWLAPGRYQNG